MNKTIIHPTDFSTCASVAYEYAVKLAKQLDCELLIVHAIDGHQMESFQSGRALIAKSKEIEEEAERKLQELGNAAIAKGARCRAQIFNGELATELPDIIQKENPFFVVMGTTGAGSLGNMVFGSNTNAVIEYAKAPVLAVPSESVYSVNHEVVLAADLSKLTEEVAEFMNRFVNALGSSLKLLFVVDQGENLYGEKHTTRVKAIFTQFKDAIDLEVVLIENDEYIEGVNGYILEHKPELFAIVASDKNFVEKFLYGSLSEKLIYHSAMPLLVLPNRLR